MEDGHPIVVIKHPAKETIFLFWQCEYISTNNMYIFKQMDTKMFSANRSSSYKSSNTREQPPVHLVSLLRIFLGLTIYYLNLVKVHSGVKEIVKAGKPQTH